MAETAQEKAIRKSVLDAAKRRDRYAEERVQELVGILDGAADDVARQIARFEKKAVLKDWQVMRMAILKDLEGEIDTIAKEVAANGKIGIRSHVEGAMRLGIEDGIGQLEAMQIPDFQDLSNVERNALVKRTFSTIDRSAIDLFANYELQLLGDVTSELAAGIKRQVSIGILTGKSIPQISRDIGGVIKDPDAFRRAGKTTFKSAQHRATLIARTETLRAHNEGRKVFYKQVGVGRVKWLTADDDRLCPICRPLNNVEFEIDDLEGPPKHPACRCTVVAVVGKNQKVEQPKEPEQVFVCNASTMQLNAQAADGICVPPPPVKPGGDALREDLREQQAFDSANSPKWKEGKTREQREAIDVRIMEKQKPLLERAEAEIAAAERYAKTNYSDWASGLTSGERQAFKAYTDAPSGKLAKIQEPLRRGKMPTGAAGTHVKRLDAAIARSPLKDDLDVYRGINGPMVERLQAQGGLSVGSEFTDRGYVSTSMGTRVPIGVHSGGMSEGAVVRIRLKKGQKAAIIGNGNGASQGTYGIGELTRFQENEVVLPRDTRFRVVGTEKVPMGSVWRKVTTTSPDGTKFTRWKPEARYKHVVDMEVVE